MLRALRRRAPAFRRRVHTHAASTPPRTRALYALGATLALVGAGAALRAPTHLDAAQPPARDPPLSAADRARIDDALRAHAHTHAPGAGSGIARVDTGQLASNAPCEDVHVEATLPVPTGSWSFFGVYDGHSGWDTAAFLRAHLVTAVAGALADLYHACAPGASEPGAAAQEAHPDPPPEDTARAIKAAFVALDDDIVHGPLGRVRAAPDPRAAAARELGPAHAGACALLAFYDSRSGLLHVALTGDSRAVLGRRVPAADGGAPVYEAHALSADQDGHNPGEVARLAAAHPGEAVVRGGRVLGMGPARAFGDARYKWPLDVQTALKRDHLGRSLLPNVKTPPYLTAEPEVVTVRVQPGDFLVLATDGLWEALDNEDAVGLVGWWRQTQDAPATSLSKALPTDLPVRRADGEPSRSPRYGHWYAAKRFVADPGDANAATHLIRNALGGANTDLLNALLLIPAPRSRVYRDDITATVVFFDE